MEKKFLDEQSLILDSFRLGVRIFESGFKPTFIVGLWRGGSSVGIYVQECLQTLGIETNHISLRTSYRGQPYYQEMANSPVSDIRVHGTRYLLENLNADDSLLIVDDVFDTGKSVEAIINELRNKARLNTPDDIRIAVPYYKPSRNQISREPDYVVHETSDWLKYPHSLEGLSAEEMAQKRPEIYEIIKDHLPQK
jgi:hypothetical protein